MNSRRLSPAPEAPSTPAKLGVRVRVNHDTCTKARPEPTPMHVRVAPELVACTAEGGSEHERGAQHLGRVRVRVRGQG